MRKTKAHLGEWRRAEGIKWRPSLMMKRRTSRKNSEQVQNAKIGMKTWMKMRKAEKWKRRQRMKGETRRAVIRMKMMTQRTMQECYYSDLQS
jgi:hypothetical protein